MKSTLYDGFGRLHDSLRISVTDRCNIRCFYCMPESGVKFLDQHETLSYEEVERFARIAVKLGVRKIRLTGGEPLIRKDVAALVRKLTAIPNLDDLALTTNGVLLAEQAYALRTAGLRRLNVHLDTLDAGRFARITKRDELPRVLAGLAEARRLGFQIKINVVAVKNLAEPDILPLARFGREQGFEIRFIEFMPLDGQHLWERQNVLRSDDILAMLAEGIGPLEEVPDADPRAPALAYRYADGVGRVGFISPITKPFCLNCNRIRLTSDGKLRYCLFALEETDVKALLRGGATDEAIAGAIRSNVQSKWLGHEVNSPQFVAPPRPMYSIGG